MRCGTVGCSGGITVGADAPFLEGEPGRGLLFQIRPPAAATATRRMVLGLVGVGIALVAVMGWTAHRLSVRETAPIVPQPAPMMTETPRRNRYKRTSIPSWSGTRPTLLFPRRYGAGRHCWIGFRRSIRQRPIAGRALMRSQPT